MEISNRDNSGSISVASFGASYINFAKIFRMKDSTNYLAGLVLKNETATKRLAGGLADIAMAGDVICLYGDLGAGKTNFARAFIRSLTSEREVVPSPTFTLVQTYPMKRNSNMVDIYHIDLYRIRDPVELIELGLQEAFQQGISLVEWPECAEDILPSDRLKIYFDFDDSADSRSVEVYGTAKWKPGLDGLKALAAKW